MRLVRVETESTLSDLPDSVVVCHDVRNPASRSEVLARKGTPVQREMLRGLLAAGVREIHVAVPEDGDLSEDAAAERLSAVVVGDGVQSGQARFGETALTATIRGMLRVHASTLHAVNAQQGVLVLTVEPDRPVEVGTTVGLVKCAPLFLPAGTVECVRAITATAGPVVELQSFAASRVAFIAPGERLRGGAFERASGALASALDWYGSSLEPVISVSTQPEEVARAYRQAVDAGVDLIFAAGASATDPLDLMFDGLRAVGGEVQQIGIPAEPGTACWIGTVSDTPVLGLASCELFGRPGALDLLLPRLLTGERLSRELVGGLALGGLLNGPSRIAPYHSHDATDD
jgi:hypothetical protein